MKRITTKIEGKIKETNIYIMTFNTPTTPKELKIGYNIEKIEQYIPNPLKCFKCQRYGHHQDRCTRLPVCGRCGEQDIHIDCQKNYKCINCQGNHHANSRNCETWKKEKEIIRLKYTKKCNLPGGKTNGRNHKICRSRKKKYPRK